VTTLYVRDAERYTGQSGCGMWRICMTMWALGIIRETEEVKYLEQTSMRLYL
jgi:hypothetical protein